MIPNCAAILPKRYKKNAEESLNRVIKKKIKEQQQFNKELEEF